MENNADKKLLETYNNIKNNELNYWDANANLIQKEFIGYEQKVDYASRGVNHIISELKNSKLENRGTLYFNQTWKPQNQKI